MDQAYTYIKSLALKLLPKSFLQFMKKWHYIRRLKKFDETYQLDTKVIKHLIDKNDEVIDIGANFGIYTYFMSPLAKKVYSYEPIPDTFEILSSIIQNLRLQNTKPINCAVSDQNTFVTMEIPTYASGGENTYLARIVNGNGQNNYRQVTVKTVTLDEEFSNNAEFISFVKCDVEGHELACINGAKDFLQRSNAAWLMEVSTDPDEKGTAGNQIFVIFSRLGYEVFWFDGKKLKLRKQGDKNCTYFFLSEKHLNILKQRNPLLLPKQFLR